MQLVPIETTIIVANVLPSGAAFAVRLDNGDNCYIPVSVSKAGAVALGAELAARLVPNRFPDKADRTPWLAVHAARPTSAAPAPLSRAVQYAMPFEQFDLTDALQVAEPTTADRVRATLTGGGVWTVGTLFERLFPGKTRGDGLTDYNAISGAIRAMYARGECAKFQLWRSPDQTKPSREWFTCYPEKADVDEWEE
jgi:hypothetical protein